MIKEKLLRFTSASRYAAHGMIDHSLAALTRVGARRWHAVVLDVDQEALIGCIRTNDPTVIGASPGAWAVVPIAAIGKSIEAVIQYVPAKPKAWNRFRAEDVFAIDHVLARVEEAAAFSPIGLTVKLISRTAVHVNKPSNGYSAPSAWFRVTGTVADVPSLEQLMLDGIGGSRTFGVGKLIDRTSWMYDLCDSVAHGLVDFVDKEASETTVPTLLTA